MTDIPPTIRSSAPAPPASDAPKCSIEVIRRGSPLQVFGPWRYEHKRLRLSLPSLPREGGTVRLMHITDMHFHTRWSRAYDELIEQTRRDPPDLILFTGDFVHDKIDHRPSLPLVERLVTQLRAREGKLAIIGNHDGDLLLPRLRKWGVTYVGERRLILEARGRHIEFIGLPGADREDLTREFIASQPRRQPDLPRIVLAHFPDEIHQASPLRSDLYLAGHTHGGQICLPGKRAIITHDSLPRHMSGGVHDIDGTVLVVNRGMGFSKFPVRVFCPAEVIEIVLTPKG